MIQEYILQAWPVLAQKKISWKVVFDQ